MAKAAINFVVRMMLFTFPATSSHHRPEARDADLTMDGEACILRAVSPQRHPQRESRTQDRAVWPFGSWQISLTSACFVKPSPSQWSGVHPQMPDLTAKNWTGTAAWVPTADSQNAQMAMIFSGVVRTRSLFQRVQYLALPNHSSI